MPKTFLYAHASEEDDANWPIPNCPERDKVRILVIGRPQSINRVIREMSHVGFSDVIEWSKSLPTDRPQESMRILTRYVFAEK
jgi:hypothetical protein